MKKPSFVYVIYVHATAEAVWRGLLDPEFTRRYWMHENTSDWKPGSGWTHRRTDPDGTVDIVGKVLESEPPRRLVLTWAPPSGAANAEKTSLVTFEIAPEDWPRGPWISLRVTHSDLEPDSEMLHSVSWGWPALMSGLKTLLESPGVFGMAELPKDERDRVVDILRHLAAGSFPLDRLARGKSAESAEVDRVTARTSLEAFMGGIGSLRLDLVPPEIRLHAQAGYEALLGGDYETARRETGRAGTLLETFIAEHFARRC